MTRHQHRRANVSLAISREIHRVTIWLMHRKRKREAAILEAVGLVERYFPLPVDLRRKP